MKLCIAVVFALCIVGAIAEDNSYYGSVREAFSLYNECSQSEGLSPCLKIKALSVIDRISRMEKLSFLDGVVITGVTEEIPNEPSLEEVEKTLPRSLDAKSQALTSMIFDRIARMIGSKSIEISVPTLVESARKKDEDDDKFSALTELLGDKFGGSSGGDKEGLLSKLMKKKNKKGGEDMMKHFFMKMMAHKMAMIPLFIAGLFLLAVKAFTQAKIALLIAGIIFGKKLLASKGQGGGGGKPQHVEHVQAGWSGGAGAGGWSGGAGGGGWSSGGEDGWKRRSLEGAQTLAYQGQQHAL